MTSFKNRLYRMCFERYRLAPRSQMRAHLRHGLGAVLSVSCAAAITLLLNATIGWTPFVLLYVAVGVSAWYGGLGWGLCAVALATAALHVFLLEPLSPSIDSTDNTARLVFFACLAVGVGYLTTVKKTIDLHQQTLLQHARTARSDAERLTQMQEDFLATVSHELRTPLNCILGWVGLIRGETLSSHENQQALAIIERNAMSQLQLIDDLLDVNRIAAGKLRLVPAIVDLFRNVSTTLRH